MGHPGGPLLCLDHRPPGLLPHRPLLPGPGDQEVREEAEQGRQQGGAGLGYPGSGDVDGSLRETVPGPGAP